MGRVSVLQVEEEVRGREKQLNAILRDKKTIKVHAQIMPDMYSTCKSYPTCIYNFCFRLS